MIRGQYTLRQQSWPATNKQYHPFLSNCKSRLSRITERTMVLGYLHEAALAASNAGNTKYNSLMLEAVQPAFVDFLYKTVGINCTACQISSAMKAFAIFHIISFYPLALCFGYGSFARHSFTMFLPGGFCSTADDPQHWVHITHEVCRLHQVVSEKSLMGKVALESKDVLDILEAALLKKPGTRWLFYHQLDFWSEVLHQEEQRRLSQQCCDCL